MNKNQQLKDKIYNIIFESETPAGKLFDLILLAMILLSVVLLMMETMPSVRIRYGKELFIIEWIFMFFFLIEYLFAISEED